MKTVQSNFANRFFPMKFLTCTVLSTLLITTVVGCGGSGTGGTTKTGVTGTQTGQSPSIPPGWTPVSLSYVSFAYPSNGYTLQQSNGANPGVAVSDGKNDMLLVEFVPGFINKASATQQCEGVITEMQNLIDTVWGAYENPGSNYPQTQMQQQGITTGGSLGGAVGNFDLIYFASPDSEPQPAGSFQIQGVPRQGGLYIVVAETPDSTPASQQLLQQFLGTIQLKSPSLASTDYCNYLG